MDGVVYSQHGWPNHHARWYQNRNKKLAMYTPDGTLNHADISKTQIAV